MVLTRTEIVELLDWRFSSRILFIALMPWAIVIIVMIAPDVLESLLAWRWTGLQDSERRLILALSIILSASAASTCILGRIR